MRLFMPLVFAILLAATPALGQVGVQSAPGLSVSIGQPTAAMTETPASKLVLDVRGRLEEIARLDTAAKRGAMMQKLGREFSVRLTKEQPEFTFVVKQVYPADRRGDFAFQPAALAGLPATKERWQLLPDRIAWPGVDSTTASSVGIGDTLTIHGKVKIAEGFPRGNVVTLATIFGPTGPDEKEASRFVTIYVGKIEKVVPGKKAGR